MNAFLKVKDVSKKYADDIQVLKGLSFQAKKGEVISILGESGSGKSTLLRIIAGLLDADSGIVKVKNEQITGPLKNLVPGYKHIRLVHQDFELGPNLTVSENIRDELLDYTDDYQEYRLEELLQLCKIEDKADKMPRELSGGQQQRVAIARALAHEPEVVLMDEPFSNLDYSLKNEIRDEIAGIIKETGATLIMVSHDPTDAMAVADRIMVIEKGKVVQMDTPEHLYQQPINKYVANFLGPVNELVSGELIRPERFVNARAGKYDGQVMKSIFQGMHYVNSIKSDSCKGLATMYSRSPLVEGSSIKFSIQQP